MTETPKLTPAPPLPPEIEAQLVKYGRETLKDKAGMALAEWEEQMIEHLGGGVRPHLRRAWDTIHRTDATLRLMEEPETMGENKIPRDSRVKRWLAITVGVLVIGQLALWLIGRDTLCPVPAPPPIATTPAETYGRLAAEAYNWLLECYGWYRFAWRGGLAALAIVLLLALVRPVMLAGRWSRSLLTLAWRRVRSHDAAVLRVGQRAALWAIVVAVLFALGIAWTGGLYTVTIDKPHGRVYRVNRLTGSVEVARCRNSTDGYVDCLWVP